MRSAKRWGGEIKGGVVPAFDQKQAASKQEPEQLESNEQTNYAQATHLKKNNDNVSHQAPRPPHPRDDPRNRLPNPAQPQPQTRQRLPDKPHLTTDQQCIYGAPDGEDKFHVFNVVISDASDYTDDECGSGSLDNLHGETCTITQWGCNYADDVTDAVDKAFGGAKVACMHEDDMTWIIRGVSRWACADGE